MAYMKREWENGQGARDTGAAYVAHEKSLHPATTRLIMNRSEVGPFRLDGFRIDREKIPPGHAVGKVHRPELEGVYKPAELNLTSWPEYLRSNILRDLVFIHESGRWVLWYGLDMKSDKRWIITGKHGIGNRPPGGCAAYSSPSNDGAYIPSYKLSWKMVTGGSVPVKTVPARLLLLADEQAELAHTAAAAPAAHAAVAAAEEEASSGSPTTTRSTSSSSSPSSHRRPLTWRERRAQRAKNEAEELAAERAKQERQDKSAQKEATIGGKSSEMPIPTRLARLEAALGLPDSGDTFPARLAAIEGVVHGGAQAGGLISRIAAAEGLCGVLESDLGRVASEYSS